MNVVESWHRMGTALRGLRHPLQCRNHHSARLIARRSSGPQYHNQWPKTIRILVVSPWGLGGGYSGPLVLMDRLFAEIADHGATIDVLYRERSAESIPNWADRLHPVSVGTKHFGRLSQLQWAVSVGKYARKHRHEYEIVHLQGAYISNILPFAFARGDFALAVLPVVQHGDLALPRSVVAKAIKQHLYGSVLRSSAFGLALSEGIRREFEALGMPPRCVIALPNVASPGAFKGNGKTKPTSKRVRLGFVGKMGPIKNPILLLDAVRLLIDRGVNATGCFVGPFVSLEYREAFLDRARILDIRESIEILGYQHNVASRMQSEMDIFVLPSLSEGMPGAMVEAMMTGLPCIVTDVGAMGTHVLAAQAGYVVDADACAVASAVAKLVKNDNSWHEMSRNASKYARRNFDSREAARIYLGAIDHHTATNVMTSSHRARA